MLFFCIARSAAFAVGIEDVENPSKIRPNAARGLSSDQTSSRREMRVK